MLSDLLADTDEEVRDLSVGAEQRTAGRSPARVAREPWLGPRAGAAAGREKRQRGTGSAPGQALEAATISPANLLGLSAVGGTCARACAKPGSEAAGMVAMETGTLEAAGNSTWRMMCQE